MYSKCGFLGSARCFCLLKHGLLRGPVPLTPLRPTLCEALEALVAVVEVEVEVVVTVKDEEENTENNKNQVKNTNKIQE